MSDFFKIQYAQQEIFAYPVFRSAPPLSFSFPPFLVSNSFSNLVLRAAAPNIGPASASHPHRNSIVKGGR
jgi:hypothetical protein